MGETSKRRAKETASFYRERDCGNIAGPPAFPCGIQEITFMLRWAFLFLILGLIAGALGFTGVAGASIGIAKVLFFIFLVIFLAMLILGLTIFRAVDGR
jgi:uncharacterized membrane protein YtjA (UPF0391 family)